MYSMTFSRSSEKLTARRAKERKEQYKQVRAHVQYSMTFSRSSEKLTARRAKERKEQYKQVRAHVKKDDGRLQVGYRLHTVLYELKK
jgi:hypothetical protein